MADIKLVDVTVHIDENIDTGTRADVERNIRNLDGVVSVHMPQDKPHLCMVEYNPDRVSSQGILRCVTAQDVHAELIGL